MPAFHPPPPISPTHAVGERGRPSHAQSQPALRVERPGLRRVAPAGRACADAQARGRHTHGSTMRTVVDAAWRQLVTDHLPPPSEPAAYAPSLHAWTLGGVRCSVQSSKTHLPAYHGPCLWYHTKKSFLSKAGKGARRAQRQEWVRGPRKLERTGLGAAGGRRGRARATGLDAEACRRIPASVHTRTHTRGGERAAFIVREILNARQMTSNAGQKRAEHEATEQTVASDSMIPLSQVAPSVKRAARPRALRPLGTVDPPWGPWTLRGAPWAHATFQAFADACVCARAVL